MGKNSGDGNGVCRYVRAMIATLENNSTHCEVETAVIIDGAEAGCDHDPATIYSNQYESF